MVLRILAGLIIISAFLFPGLCFCQLNPVLIACEGTVSVAHLDNRLTAAIEQMKNTGAISDVLAVYTKSSIKKKIYQPIAGHYQLVGSSLVFTPFFPFAPGETYYARFAHEKNKLLEVEFEVPSLRSAATFIEAVYPAADTLPENLLRMYIYFSSPMTTGEAYQHIRLIDADGNTIEKPFLVVDQELWDENRRRFTLLFDPGRVKRGIRSNLDLGSPLQVGKSYRLVIDSAWRDEHGKGLNNAYEKRFAVKSPERSRVTTNHWKIVAPAFGTKNPLIVQFDKPMDHFLALKYIAVFDPRLEEVNGDAFVTQGDMVWEFHPRQDWKAASYMIRLSSLFEDVSGNNFSNAFDVDVFVEAWVISEIPIEIPFAVSDTLNGNRWSGNR